MIRRLFFLVAGGGFFLLSVFTIPVYAQEWQQELQVITPLRTGDPLTVLLDSLVSTLERSPDIRVRRSPDDRESMSFGRLQDALYAEGADLRNASHALIRYRFDLAGQGVPLVETIEDLYFIFRLDESVADRPLLYLSTGSAAVNDVLVTRGIPSPVNMRSFEPFRTMVSFPILRRNHELAVVELGGQSLRNPLTVQQTQILTFLDQYATGDAGVYQLTTHRDHVSVPSSSAMSTSSVRRTSRR